MFDHISILHEDESVVIHADEESVARADAVLVSFTGIGHGMGGIDVQRIEFAGTAHRHGGLIVVTDKKRSWGNNLDSAQLAGILRPLLAGKTVITIGNSMGGFLALLFARAIGARLAIAFAPQFSVARDIVPEEPRWMEYRQHISALRYPSLQGCFDARTVYYTINGSTPLEEIHWKRFPAARNLHHFVLPSIGHDVAIQLKKAAVLGRVIDDALAERLSVASFGEIPVRKLPPDSPARGIRSTLAGLVPALRRRVVGGP